MGWMFTHKEKGVSVKAFFQKEFSSLEIIDCASFLDVAYLAVKKQDGSVVALICLIRHQHNSWENFGYKDMDETMGVYQYTCPERILKRLTPTDDETSQRWRNRCQEYQRQRKQLMAGCTIKFEKPFTFTNGESLDTFQTWAKKNTLVFFHQGSRYTIHGWEQHLFQVLDAV